MGQGEVVGASCRQLSSTLFPTLAKSLLLETFWYCCLKSAWGSADSTCGHLVNNLMLNAPMSFLFLQTVISVVSLPETKQVRMSPRFEQCWPHGQDFVRLYLSLFISLNILKERLQEIEKVGKAEKIWMVLSHTTGGKESSLPFYPCSCHSGLTVWIWCHSSRRPTACMCGTPLTEF